MLKTGVYEFVTQVSLAQAGGFVKGRFGKTCRYPGDSALLSMPRIGEIMRRRAGRRAAGPRGLESPNAGLCGPGDCSNFVHKMRPYSCYNEGHED